MSAELLEESGVFAEGDGFDFFRGAADALRHLGDAGWELTATSLHVTHSAVQRHYVLKRLLAEDV